MNIRFDRALSASLIATLIGLGVDLMGNTLDRTFPNAPDWVWKILFWVGVALILTFPIWILCRYVFPLIGLGESVAIRSAKETLQKLDQDDRYVIRMEANKSSFGPYLHPVGRYGHLSWDQVRSILAKLITLDVIVMSSDPNRPGQYEWTRKGCLILEQLTTRVLA